MARKKQNNNEEVMRYEPLCKVCNSHFKTMIESLHDCNLSAKQIFEALNALTDPQSKEQLAKEKLNEGSISRHLSKHYSSQAKAALKQASNQDRLFRSRELFKDGIQTKINTISTLAHLIDVALINLESLDSFPDGRQRHQLTINYMN